MLPRGPRGRHAPEFEARHVARVLLGTMVVATDALNTPTARVAAAVATIQVLERGALSPEEKETHEVRTSHENGTSLFYSNVPFVDIIAAILTVFGSKNTEKAAVVGPPPPNVEDAPKRTLTAFGVRFSGGEVCGYLVAGEEGGHTTQIVYAAKEKALLSTFEKGLVREAWISPQEFLPVAALVDEDADGEATTLGQTADE